MQLQKKQKKFIAPPKKTGGTTVFNLGLSTQESVHDLFVTAHTSFLYNEPLSRCRALISIKRMIESELLPEEKNQFDRWETHIQKVYNEFFNQTVSNYCFYDSIQRRYILRKTNKSNVTKFSDIYWTLEQQLNYFEGALRMELSPILFPKSKGKAGASDV